jgi:hypothetical protein
LRGGDLWKGFWGGGDFSPFAACGVVSLARWRLRRSTGQQAPLRKPSRRYTVSKAPRRQVAFWNRGRFHDRQYLWHGSFRRQYGAVPREQRRQYRRWNTLWGLRRDIQAVAGGEGRTASPFRPHDFHPLYPTSRSCCERRSVLNSIPPRRGKAVSTRWGCNPDTNGWPIVCCLPSRSAWAIRGL